MSEAQDQDRVLELFRSLSPEGKQALLEAMRRRCTPEQNARVDRKLRADGIRPTTADNTRQ